MTPTISKDFQAERSDTPFMGEVRVQVYVEKAFDREAALRGLWDPARIRSMTIEMIVDTGSTLVALPESLVDQLGLRRQYVTPSYLADGSGLGLWIASGVTLRIDDRQCTVSCVAMPDGSPPLLGQVPLEEMDFLVDCRGHKLVGKHPEGHRLSLY